MRWFSCLFLIIVLSWAARPAAAQSFAWAQAQALPDGVGFSQPEYAVAADAQGNVVVGGWHDRPVHHGVTLGRLRLAKYTSGGTQVFSQVLGGRVRIKQIHCDASQRILVLGQFKDSVWVAPNRLLLSTSQGLQHFLAQYDAQGQLLWAHHLEQWLTPNLASSQTLTTDATGAIYLAYYDNNDNTNVVRVRPDGQGTPQVVVRQQHVAVVSSLSLDSRGNLYVAGSCAETNAVFNSRAFPHQFLYNLYVARYSPQGLVRWVEYVEDITCPNLNLAPLPGGGVAVAGYAIRGQQFGPFQAQGPTWNNNYFVASLDSTGTWQWLREMPRQPGSIGAAGAGSLTCLTTDAAGNSYLVGSTRGTVPWLPGTVTTSTRDAVLLLSYDVQGNLRWVRVGTSTGFARAHSVALGPGGDVYVAGNATAAVQFGVQSATGATPISPLSFLAKLTGNALAATSGRSASAWSVWPNPAANQVQVRFGATSPLPRQLRVLDALGRVVLETAVTGPALSLDLRPLPAGAYLLQAGAAGQRWQSRLLKQ